MSPQPGRRSGSCPCRADGGDRRLCLRFSDAPVCRRSRCSPRRRPASWPPRNDAGTLDSKAGILLGFAGVVVALGVASLSGTLADLAASSAAVAAATAGVAFLPRSYPTLALRRLRDAYLTADEEFTRLRVLDTRIAMFQRTEKLLRIKGLLVTAAACALGVAVVLTVLAGTLEN